MPYCKIERDVFLTSQLKGKIRDQQLSDALENGTINAGISITVLNHIALGAVNMETTKTAALSTAAEYWVDLP